MANIHLGDCIASRSGCEKGEERSSASCTALLATFAIQDRQILNEVYEQGSGPNLRYHTSRQSYDEDQEELESFLLDGIDLTRSSLNTTWDQ